MVEEVKNTTVSPIKKEIVQRLTLVYLLVLVFAVFVIIQILYLQNFERAKWEEKSKTLQYKEVQANRGDICAIDGRLLATSLPYYSVHMDMKSPALKDTIFRKHVDSLAFYLSQLFKDKPKQEYLKALKDARKKGNRFFLIKSRVNYTDLKRMKKFPIFRLGRYKGGLLYIQENKRIQPHSNLASRTIGYISKDERGNIVGLEGAFDKILAGTNGMKLMMKMPSGDWRPLESTNDIEPEDGGDVITTLDVNIQDVAEKALMRQLMKHNAKYGSVVLMEVKTGEVRAIVNLTRTNDNAYKEVFNYAVGESFEPGSTFKLPTLIAALETGQVDIKDTINTEDGTVKIGDFIIRDSKKGGYGRITVQQVFEHSSNVGMAKIIYKMFKKHPEEFIDRLYSMSLNEKVGIEIKGEKKPYIKYPGDPLWSGVSIAQMAIGYEVKLSPIQILTFYNAVANDGKMVKPLLVKAFRRHGEITDVFKTQVINPSICSKETLEKVKILLEGVVERGTAENIKNPSYKIAGKTGTAQIAIGSQGYRGENMAITYQASFVGYFPAHRPKYSCIIIVNTPTNESYYGNVVAGPVFKEIADKLYAIDYEMQGEKEFDLADLPDVKGSPFSKNGFKKHLDYIFSELEININHKEDNSTSWISTSALNNSVDFKNQNVKKGIVPNVEGMGLRDALYILENAGLKVNVIGVGTITKQSIPPGSAVKKGEKITIELS